jgi:hypothetical protein
MVRKWRREIAGDVRVMRFVPCTVDDTWWGGGVKVMKRILVFKFLRFVPITRSAGVGARRLG